MATDDFDTYHSWLGIPPEEQPPNHYRLLGVRLFESSQDAIANAADRQMSYVKSLQSGKRVQDAERILTELSAAKLCLLDPEKKAVYDRGLSKQIQPQPEAIQTAPPEKSLRSPPPPAVPTSAPLETTPPQTPSASPGQSSATRPTSPIQHSKVAILLGSAVAAFLLIGLLVFVWQLVRSSGTPGPQPKSLRLAKLTPEEITQGTRLSLPIPLVEKPTDGAEIIFELAGNVPAGCRIDAKTGTLTWRPGAETSPGLYEIDVIATLSGRESIRDEKTLVVHVKDADTELKPVIDSATLPQLAAIPKQMVGEGESLSLTARLESAPSDAGAVRFTLVAAPPGAAIEPESGEFKWTPTEAQGPGGYEVTVLARADGASHGDEVTFPVYVNELNTTPKLAKLPDQSVQEGGELRFKVIATDTDIPANQLTFQLLGSPPSGATIDDSGELVWHVDQMQPNGVVEFSLSVRDDGTPPQESVEALRVEVTPSPPGIVRTLAGHSDQVRGIAVSADGRRAVSGGVDKLPRLWEIGTAQSKLLSGHSATVNCVAFSSDHKIIATGSYDHSVRLWHGTTGTQLATLEAESDVRGIAVNSQGVLIAGGRTKAEGFIQSWDLETKRSLGNTATAFPVSALGAFPSGPQIIVGGWQGELEVFDVRGREIFTLPGHTDRVDSVEVADDGLLALSSSGADSTVKIWDLKSRKMIHAVPNDTGDKLLCQAAFIGDGQYFVSGGMGIKIWETETGKLVQHLEHDKMCGIISPLPDGRFVLSGSVDGDINLWRLPSDFASR